MGPQDTQQAKVYTAEQLLDIRESVFSGFASARASHGIGVAVSSGFVEIGRIAIEQRLFPVLLADDIYSGLVQYRNSLEASMYIGQSFHGIEPC